MEAFDVEPMMHDILTKGDPKITLSLLLTITIMALREKWFANVTMKNRFGDFLRWLAGTHGGGVLSSIVGAGLGAIVTALSTKTIPSPSALVNVFFVAAAASGMATWTKFHKMKKPKPEEKAEENAPAPPPVVVPIDPPTPLVEEKTEEKTEEKAEEKTEEIKPPRKRRAATKKPKDVAKP